MNKILTKFLIIIFLSLDSSYLFAGGGHDHGHDDHEHEEHTGPHGCKLLEKDKLSLELCIFEEDRDPVFRAYIYNKNRLVKDSDSKIQIKLKRFEGSTEDYLLLPENEYLSSDKVVEELHSFDLEISLTTAGQTAEWKYSSHEGRTELGAEALKLAKLGIDTVQPARIASISQVYGRIIANQNQLAKITPRFPGVVKQIYKELGDKVKKGDLLANIESNQSLQLYELRSPIDGEIIAREAAIGEFVSDSREILVVANLSELWADFQVYRDSYDRIEKGQKIEIDIGDNSKLQAAVQYVSPVTDEATQSKLVRAKIPNSQGKLRPGLFVSANIISSYTEVPIAVKLSAIQTFRDWQVVYLTNGHTFQAVPVELGRKDTEFVEILSGLSQGQKYVSENSFIIKADVEKSGASHDH